MQRRMSACGGQGLLSVVASGPLHEQCTKAQQDARQRRPAAYVSHACTRAVFLAAGMGTHKLLQAARVGKQCRGQLKDGHLSYTDHAQRAHRPATACAACANSTHTPSGRIHVTYTLRAACACVTCACACVVCFMRAMCAFMRAMCAYACVLCFYACHVCLNACVLCLCVPRVLLCVRPVHLCVPHVLKCVRPVLVRATCALLRASSAGVCTTCF